MFRVKFNNGEDCNIELQVAPYPYMAERMLEYWSGMYDNKINCSEGYEVLKPSISILIANYELEETKFTSRYHTVWNLREKDCQNMILTKNIEMHSFEYKGRTEGREEGRAEGKAEGEASKAKQIAKKMKAKNMQIDEIIELTGLTKEEIDEL